MGILAFTQTLTYAWRPRCLFALSEYVFDQWFYKEAIPKSALVKRLGKRKLNTDTTTNEDNDEEQDPDARIEEDQTGQYTSEDMPIEQGDILSDMTPQTNVDIQRSDRASIRRELPQDKLMISRQDIRAMMSPDGRATHILFQIDHPQFNTHRLALNKTRHIPVLNGSRTRGVETVRNLVISANIADEAQTDTIPQQPDQQEASPVTSVRPGDALREQADKYALQILALHKPWDGTGENILDVEVPNGPADEASTHILRLTSYSECLLKWVDAEGSAAIPLHTKRILEHHQTYFDLKRIASNMSHARRKQQRQALGLPPTNETRRLMHADENSDDDEDFYDDDDDTPMEDAHTATDIATEPRRLDRVTRAMLDSLHIGTYGRTAHIPLIIND